MANPPTAKLLFENGPNWVYATGTTISDPALYYQSPTGKSHIVVNELEWGHLKSTATVDKVHSYAEVRAAIDSGPVRLESIIAWLISLDGKSIASIQVPQNFPAELFMRLRAAGLPLEVCPDALIFPERAKKRADEIKKLAQAGKANDAAYEHAIGILKASKIQKNNTLKWQNATLTSDILRGEMNALLVKLGCIRFADGPYAGPVVACGEESATPHAMGHGPLKAHELIIIDCFPKGPGGYFADCTRTFLKGKPSAEQANLYHTVMVAQEMALKLIKPEVNGRHIQQAVEQFFEKAGYETGTDAKGNPFGFFHGVGHGVGLELHEPGPRMITKSDCVLEEGFVTSVEPGLYYPGLGGVRIEDTVVVTATGYKSFTSLSKKDWLIK